MGERILEYNGPHRSAAVAALTQRLTDALTDGGKDLKARFVVDKVDGSIAVAATMSLVVQTVTAAAADGAARRRFLATCVETLRREMES